MKKINKKKFVIISVITISIMMVNILLFVNRSNALSKYGSRGSEVTTIQTKLKRWGYYSGTIDRSIWKSNS